MALQLNTGRGCSSRLPPLLVPNSAHGHERHALSWYEFRSQVAVRTQASTWYVTALPFVICYNKASYENHCRAVCYVCKGAVARDEHLFAENRKQQQQCTASSRFWFPNSRTNPADSVQQQHQQQEEEEEHDGSSLCTHVTSSYVLTNLYDEEQYY